MLLYAGLSWLAHLFSGTVLLVFLAVLLLKAISGLFSHHRPKNVDRDADNGAKESEEAA